MIHCQRLVIEAVGFFPIVLDTSLARSPNEHAIHKSREQAIFVIHLVHVIMDTLQRIVLGVCNKTSIIAIDHINVHLAVIALVLTQVLVNKA